MIRARHRPPSKEDLRAALRRRIRLLYEALNQRDWPRCFKMLDPKLRETERVNASDYAKSLAEFQQSYGHVEIRHIEISLYLDARGKNDSRPFAYTYVLWKDARGGVHLFRERWVLDERRWFTRVVGLVSHANSTAHP
jgi:hypothetical protein